MKRHILRLSIILVGFVVASVFAALQESVSYDEVVNIEEGLNAWKYGTFAVETNNPPLTRNLAVLPLVLHPDGIQKNSPPTSALLYPRLVIIFLSASALVVLFLFVRNIFGVSIALLSVFFLAFEPTFFAHSHLITQDAGITAFVLFFVYALWRFLSQPSGVRLLYVSIIAGYMLVSKLTGIPYGIGIGIGLVSLGARDVWKVLWKYWLLGLIVMLGVIWSVYFFRWDVIVAEREDASRVSSRLRAQAIATNNKVMILALDGLMYQKVPLGNFLASVKNSLIRSGQQSVVFYSGLWYKKSPFGALIATFFQKTSLVFLFVSLAGLGVMLTHPRFCSGRRYVLIPLMVIVGVSTVTSLQPWVRYMLPVYPFIAILGGIGTTVMMRRNAVFGIIIIGLVLARFISVFPHAITSVNESIGVRPHWQIMFSDSNIDMGQSLPEVYPYLVKHAIETVEFSYFGRDDGAWYGLPSEQPYGGHTFSDICSFHTIYALPGVIQRSEEEKSVARKATLISIPNWHGCGYWKMQEYQKDKIRDVIGDVILVF